MDEFKKPYEYDDEEKSVSGLLLVFFIMLLVEESFLGVISVFFGYNRIPENRVFGVTVMCIGFLYVAFAVFSAVVLKLKKKYAVKVLKTFLIARMFYLIPYLIFNTLNQIANIPYFKENEMYWVAYNSIITSLIVSLSFAIAFSVGWYVYLIKSKKVKELFPITKAAA